MASAAQEKPFKKSYPKTAKPATRAEFVKLWAPVFERNAERVGVCVLRPFLRWCRH